MRCKKAKITTPRFEGKKMRKGNLHNGGCDGYVMLIVVKGLCRIHGLCKWRAKGLDDG